MGFFSAKCKGCSHPLLSHHATNKINAWMQQAVLITPKNQLVEGEYDGYGLIGDIDEDETPYDRCELEKNSIYHRACWLKAGAPRTFQGKSEYAEDQGFFFDEGEHDMLEPGRETEQSKPQPGKRQYIVRKIVTYEAVVTAANKKEAGDVAEKLPAFGWDRSDTEWEVDRA